MTTVDNNKVSEKNQFSFVRFAYHQKSIIRTHVWEINRLQIQLFRIFNLKKRNNDIIKLNKNIQRLLSFN